MSSKPKETTPEKPPLGEHSGTDHRVMFEVVEKLGEGSYGSVWRAVEAKPQGRVIAAKRMAVESNDMAALRKEIDYMNRCRSPLIVSYFGSFSEGGILWILMEYCSGGSVADLMRVCQTTLDELQISTVCGYVARGLEFLHSRKLIHRDIKCGNVLMNDAGECKLADFGVSGQLADTMAKRYTMTGSPYWIAPEVILDAGYNTSADIWSLGITLVEMAQGRPPYSDMHPMRAIFTIPSRPPPVLADPDRWSPQIKDFLTSCCRKAPEQRYTATALLRHPFIASTPLSPRPLLPLLQIQQSKIAALGREKALGIDSTQSPQDMTRSLAAAVTTDTFSVSMGSVLMKGGPTPIPSGLTFDTLDQALAASPEGGTGTVVIHPSPQKK